MWTPLHEIDNNRVDDTEMLASSDDGEAATLNLHPMIDSGFPPDHSGRRSGMLTPSMTGKFSTSVTLPFLETDPTSVIERIRSGVLTQKFFQVTRYS